MSKLSKRVDELQSQVATLQKQMSCDCSNFEVVAYYTVGAWDIWYSLDDLVAYKRKCLSCGLETAYASKDAAMKDEDALLKAKIDSLTAERKSLKDE